MDIVDELIRGREAFRRHEWMAARDRLSAPDLASLDPADLHALATAAFLVGDMETCVQAWQRSFQVHSDDGENLAAARDALWLTMALLKSGNEAAARGWQARAARSLDAEPDDVAEHGFLKMQLDVPADLQWAFRGGVRARGGRCRVRTAASRTRSRRDRPGVPRPDADLLRPGPRGARAPGRGDGPGCCRGGLVDHGRPDLLHDDRRLPGDRRHPPDDGLDPDAHPVVRAAAGPRPVHGSVVRAPGPDHAVPGSMGAGAGGARARRGAVRVPGRA